MLSVPRVRKCFGSRSFAVAAPTIWNTLHIRNSPSICCFRRHLKTFFYNLVLSHLSPHHIPWPPNSGGRVRVDIVRSTNSLTYLLKASNIFVWRPWPFGVTLRHLSRHRWTRDMRLPTGGQLQPYAYFARSWRYNDSNAGHLQVAVHWWSRMRAYNFRSYCSKTVSFVWYDRTRKLRSKFGEDRSIFTILSTDAGWTDSKLLSWTFRVVVNYSFDK